MVSQLLHSKTSRPVVGVLIVQTPHLCLQDLLPTSTYQSYLFLSAYLQASCRSSHLSKHLTCVSRTYSQPQPVEIFSMLISRRVVGAFTCPNTSLVSPGLTPNLSLSRYSQSFRKHVVSGNQLTSHLQQMTLQPTCHKNEVKQNTHHLNQEYSSSSMPLTLHQQHTNLVITSEP